MLTFGKPIVYIPSNTIISVPILGLSMPNDDVLGNMPDNVPDDVPDDVLDDELHYVSDNRPDDVPDNMPDCLHQ